MALSLRALGRLSNRAFCTRPSSIFGRRSNRFEPSESSEGAAWDRTCRFRDLEGQSPELTRNDIKISIATALQGFEKKVRHKSKRVAKRKIAFATQIDLEGICSLS